jgi:hypothetical protein
MIIFESNRVKQLKAQLAAAEDAIAATEERLNQAEDALKALRNAAVLVSLNRKEKLLHWTFMRHGAPIVVKTYSTMADHLPTWKRELGV